MQFSNNGNKNISHICDGIFIGSWIASKTSTLRLHKIQSVISVGADPASPFAKGIEYTSIDLLDNEKEATKLVNEILPEALPYIHENVTNTRNILIHCSAGKSRSVSIVAAYLMKYKEMGSDEAFEFIRTKRSVIDPNAGFVRALAK